LPVSPGTHRDRTAPCRAALPHHRTYGSRIRRFGWSGQTKRPVAFAQSGFRVHYRRNGHRPSGQDRPEIAHPTHHSHLPSPFGVGTVPAFDGSDQRRNSSSDFSSTMPFADCPWAIASLTARPLRVATCVCVPVAGFVPHPPQARHAEALVSRSRLLLRPYSRRTWGSPGVLPDCFRCVTVGSTCGAVSVTGTSDCVAPSSPCLPPHTRRGAVSHPLYSVRSARIFASGLFRGTVTGSPLALGYPSPLPGWDGTCLLPQAHPLAAGPCPAHNAEGQVRRACEP
jgi:hypothetical protein